MLKLEKTSQQSGLTVRLRERERFFEPRLLKALAIALILHSGALVLFQVTPFFLASTFVFPPIEVQSDHPLQGVSVLASPFLDENEELFPPLTLIPTMDWAFFSQESILNPSATLDANALQSLEERLWPKWQEPLSLKLEEPRIQLVISGDLADLSLVADDPLLNEMVPLSSASHFPPAYVAYQVQWDDKTGELFWYERFESSGVAAIDRLTEKILLNLRFSPTEASNELVTGTLNFAVLASENESNFKD